MKKHLYKLSIVAAAIALTATQSCKKDDAPASREALLIGTWNGYQTGIDSNKNGTWDMNERQAIRAGAGGQFRFDAGGTGRLKGDTTLAGAAITWTLLNSDKDLRIVVPVNASRTDTVTFNLIAVDASELVLKNTQSDNEVFTASLRQR